MSLRGFLSVVALSTVASGPAVASVMSEIFDICTSPIASGFSLEDWTAGLALRPVSVEGMAPGSETPAYEALAWTVPVFESMVSIREPAESVARAFAADVTTTWRIAGGFSRGVTFASDKAVVSIGIGQILDRDAINCIYVGHAETEDDLVLTGLRQPTRSSYFLHRVVVIRPEDAIAPFRGAIIGQSYGSRPTTAFGAEYPDLGFFRTSVSFDKEAAQ